MPKPVVHGAMLTCSFGAAPGIASMIVPPANRVLIEGKPAANVNDNKMGANIPPFGLCNSLANPVTASQTAAALGVLTPGACLPALPAPWVPTVPTKLVAGAPILTDASMCMCAYGGVIQVSFAGTLTTEVS